MANRRKKSKGRSRSKGRRVGKIPGGDGTTLIIGAIAGGIASRLISKTIASKMPSLNPKLASGVQVVAGVLVSMKSRSPFIKGIGVGIAAASGQTLIGSMVPSLAGIAGGIGDRPIVFTSNAKYLNGMPNGFQKIPKVGTPFPQPGNVGRASSDIMSYAGIYGS